MDSIKTRPRVKVVPTPTDVVVEIAAAVGLAFLVVVTAHYYSQLSARIPTHFGFYGEADQWGSKSSMIALPIVGAVVYLVLTVVGLFPHIYGYPVPVTSQNAERLYGIGASTMRWLKAETIWLFAYTQWQTVQVALGRAKGLSASFIFVTLAFVIGTLVVLLARAYKAR